MQLGRPNQQPIEQWPCCRHCSHPARQGTQHGAQLVLHVADRLLDSTVGLVVMCWGMRRSDPYRACPEYLINDILDKSSLRRFSVGLNNALTTAESSKLVFQPAYCRQVGASLACHASRHDALDPDALTSPAKEPLVHETFVRPPSPPLAGVRWGSSGARPLAQSAHHERTGR